jgi:hypothetical protein
MYYCYWISGLCPASGIVEKKKTTQCFRNWNTYSVIEANLFYRTKLRKYSLPSHLRMETYLISRMMCFIFRTPDGGRSPEFQQ